MERMPIVSDVAGWEVMEADVHPEWIDPESLADRIRDDLRNGSIFRHAEWADGSQVDKGARVLGSSEGNVGRCGDSHSKPLENNYIFNSQSQLLRVWILN